MKKFFFPIFWKFSLAIILIVLVFGSVNAYLTWSNVYSSLQKESEKRGLYIAQSLAEESINLLLYEDLVNLQKLVDNAQKLDSSIYYIIVVDEENRPVIHTFESGVPSDLLKIARQVGRNRIDINLLELKKHPGFIIRNISVPIFEGKLGTIHVGILEKEILENVSRTVNIFWIMVGLFMAVGIIGAFAFSYFITSPIKKIQDVANRLDFSTLKERTLEKITIREKLFNRYPIYFRAIDEIDLLTDRFNNMIMRLENAYADLEAANEKLLESEKMASIGVITAGLAHEINNPIAGVKNCIRRLKQRPDDSSQREKYLNLMEDAINRIEMVVKELLDFSRKKDLRIEQINLQELIEKTVLLLSYKLEKNRISVTNNLSDEIPKVIGARDRLEQVLINLLLNAIDAIEEKMNESNHPGFSGSIVFDGWSENGKVVLAITDNGTGIDEDNLAKIFDPFFTTKSIGKGTGLGLAVSQNVIMAMGGEIKVESRKGEGTTFKIYLQRAKEGSQK